MGLEYDGDKLEIIMFLVIAAISIFALCMGFSYKLTYPRLITVIIIIGLIMRVGYMLYTPYNVRQHDLGTIGSAGHLDYIYMIYSTWQLPTSNSAQFYHPPLFHFLGAVVFNIAMLFYNNNEFAFNAVRLIPCFASCFTLLVSYKIFKELNFSQLARILAITIVAIHPAFIYLSASINNDMLAIFFMTLTILYLIKWYYDQSLKNITIMAITLGLGMMTKLSVVMIAPVIAAVFIYVLIKRIKSENLVYLIAQYLAFGIISIPLGMWYSIRNLVLFRQPLGYVLQISQYSDLYCGDFSITQRFLSLPFSSLFSNAFPNVTIDYNVYLYAIKSSLFGEWTFHGYEAQATLFAIVNILIIAISLAAMIYVFISAKDSKSKFAKWLLGLIWLTQVGSFIQFNISYPFGCTMDFRYIVMTVVTGAGFIGLAYDTFRQKHKDLSKWTWIILALFILLFACNSIWFYTII